MNVWKSIHLRDVGPFGNVTFNIPKGITTIYGVNGRAANSNAAGKTMLFSSIFDTLLETPVAAEKSDRLRTGVRAVSIKLSSGKNLIVKREGSKSTIKHGDEVVSGATKVRQRLQKECPWSLEDIVSYIHIDSQVPRLVKGTNISRRQFLTRFFRLDRIDVEKSIIKGELAKLSQFESQSTNLTSQLRALEKQLPPEGLVDKLKARKNKLDVQLAELQENSEAIERARRAALFRDQARKELDHYHKGCDESGHKNPAKVYEFYRSMYREQKALLREGEHYEDYLKQKEAYEKWVSSLSPEAIEYWTANGTAKDAQARASKYHEAATKLQTLDSELQRLRKDAAVKLNRVEKPGVPRAKVLARMDVLRHQLEHAEKFGKGSCRTCGQSVKVDNPGKIKAGISKCQSILGDWEEYEHYCEESERRARARKQYTALKKDADSIRDIVRQNKKYVGIAAELRNPVDEPEPYAGKKIIASHIKKVLVELEDRLEALTFLNKHRNMFKLALSTTEINHTNDTEEIARLSREITQIEAKLERAASLERQYRDLTGELEELKPKLKRAALIRKLLAAYDDKAMKRLAIQSVSTQLMEQVNKYAKLAFTDDMRFELIWERSEVQFLVHRHYGDRVDTSDVRRLSGAETKLFTIALVLALLAFVPKNKRSSMIVLDEPAANLGQANMDIFKEMLPVINKIIPSVIIITPKTEERFGGAEYTITKIDGKTSVVKGHPSQLRRLK